jgi:hypothetical protein
MNGMVCSASDSDSSSNEEDVEDVEDEDCGETCRLGSTPGYRPYQKPLALIGVPIEGFLS